MSDKNGIFKAWAAYEVLTEMGTLGQRQGVFTTKEAATKAADGRGWYGGMGDVKEVSVLFHNGQHYLLAATEPVVLNVNEVQEREREIAEAKALLTPRQRKLLGIRD